MVRTLLAAVVICSLAAGRVSAVLYTFSASAAPSASPDANGGTADVWSVASSGAITGDLLGNSANNGSGGSAAGAGTSAWGLYAGSGSFIAASTSIAALAGKPLNVAGESVAIDFDNGLVTGGGGNVGIEFFGPNGFASALYFQGGFASYSLIDTGPGVVNTLIPWTADGLRVTLTLNNASGGYTLSALHPNSTLYSFTRTLGGSNTSITSLRVYSSSGGGSLTDREYDVYFNNLTISVIPEASAELLMATAAVAGVVVAAWRRRGESRCCPNA